MGEERVAIVWEGEVVGWLQQPESDMWYLEGVWIPEDTPKTAEFIATTALLDIRQSVANPDHAVWIGLKYEGQQPVPAVVLGQPQETVFVRRMVETQRSNTALHPTPPAVPSFLSRFRRRG